MANMYRASWPTVQHRSLFLGYIYGRYIYIYGRVACVEAITKADQYVVLLAFAISAHTSRLCHLRRVITLAPLYTISEVLLITLVGFISHIE